MFGLLKIFLLVLCAFTLVECSNSPDTLFESVPPESSGVTFANNLVYTDTLTVLDFEYLYNGAGVGIADINNDGLLDIYFSGNMTSGKLYLNKTDTSNAEAGWKFV